MSAYYWTILFCIFTFYPYPCYSACTNSSTQSDENCYQGTCLEGKCSCFDGWSGEFCNTCSGRVLLTDDSGYITDGPKNYTKEMECSWLIETTSRAPIRLRVLQFASECGWDYLYIYDGNSLYSPLLASFSGYVIDEDENFSTTYPEVVATSGSAFLYFSSDLAYHMQGFNISYEVNSCPQNCHGSGSCQGNPSSCDCDTGRTGDACQLYSCPTNCSSVAHQGVCSVDNSTGDEMCSCNSGYAGLDCSAKVPLMEGLWFEQDVVQQSYINTARSSHASVSLNNSMWSFGGIQFGDLNPNNTFTRFDFSSETWHNVIPEGVSPTSRYGHSLISYGNTLLLFGGRETSNNLTSDELWEYDILANTWTNTPYSTDWDHSNATYSPLMLWGHTATRVDFDNGTSVMVVMFGFHPYLGYSGFVYEYNMESQKWGLAVTQGATVKKSYGHSAAWDPVNKGIFVHGGYSPKTASEAYEITDQSYFYDPELRSFRKLRSSGIPRYLHSGIVLNGVHYVYGGCTHNDTAQSTGTLCYSPGSLAYLITCDVWEEIPSVSEIYNPSRYGHTAVMLSNGNASEMILYGGYNSIILHNILKYQTGLCEAFNMNSTYCTGQHHPGLSCTWHNGSCVPVAGLDEDRGVTSCAKLANSSESYCRSLGDCISCFSSSSSCKYCGSNCIPVGQACNQNSVTTNITNCKDTDQTQRYCSQLRDCSQCSLYEICQWQGRKCQARKDNTTATCPESCGTISSCEDCAKQTTCMWCVNRQQCVSTDSYVVQFPYGECMKWINTISKCPTMDGCERHSTCGSCLRDPSCGWCDDGSETGLGVCQMGSSTGPLTNTTTPMNVISLQTLPKPSGSVCPAERWYFSKCPRCQCNGHSTCVENTSDCIKCEDLTKGDQCQECIDGYFGDATNGGDCQTCQCFDRAKLCNNTSGDCFCSTKGATGDKCQRCDNKGKYYGDPANNGTCFYRLLINYSFTFSLTQDHDKYITSINFENTPSMNTDTEVSFDAPKPCNVRVTVFYRELAASQLEEYNSSNTPGKSLQYIEREVEVAKYTKTTNVVMEVSGQDYDLGSPATNATIRVYVSNFTVPIKIQISLVQTSNRLLILLLILFSCFLFLLLLTALAWKMKMVYDAWQARRRHAVELEQMAARPFSTVHLCFDEMLRTNKQNEPLIKNKHQFIDAISEENCADGNASVTSVIFWMPSGNGEHLEDEKNPRSLSAASENSLLAVGTTILTSSKRQGVEQPTSTQSHTSHSRAEKLKVVFKRGRGQTSEHHTSRHSEPCGHNHNQSNNRMLENELNHENSRQSTTQQRHKRGRSSFTSIRSVSVSPGECQGDSTPNPSSSIASPTQHRAQPIILAFNAPQDKVEVTI